MELMQDPSKPVRPRSRNEIRKASVSDILYHNLVKAILSNETNSEALTILFEIVPSPYYGPSATWFGISSDAGEIRGDFGCILPTESE